MGFTVPLASFPNNIAIHRRRASSIAAPCSHIIIVHVNGSQIPLPWGPRALRVCISRILGDLPVPLSFPLHIYKPRRKTPLRCGLQISIILIVLTSSFFLRLPSFLLCSGGSYILAQPLTPQSPQEINQSCVKSRKRRDQESDKRLQIKRKGQS